MPTFRLRLLLLRARGFASHTRVTGSSRPVQLFSDGSDRGMDTFKWERRWWPEACCEWWRLRSKTQVPQELRLLRGGKLKCGEILTRFLQDWRAYMNVAVSSFYAFRLHL